MACGAAWQDQWDLVFTRPDGRPIGSQAINDAFPRALAHAGLPPCRPHDLRHSVTTLLGAAGQHPKAVAELLGHATTDLTMRVYTHTTRAQQQDIARTMERLVGGS